MPAESTPPWAELVQLVPIISLAFPFVVKGQVDLTAVQPALMLAAALTVPAMGVVLWRGHVLNPILIGTNAWLWVAAVGLGLPIGILDTWIAEAQASGLFIGALGVGLVTTWARPGGYIGCRHPDASWVRRMSLGLLVATLVAVVWAWGFRHNIRLGGGLPFITLNLLRRITIVRAP